ncbi:uncharacterized protein LOC119080548 [Bradysia coprophila]|uniref:uncharacterized protein LOC119080548 n=1 Tax=Bradysia coprophila TaxID=38358 RepID=UPI00187DA9F7|nr:uncharacterized protein LOC119080548 [Bradysia coprophila]
MAALIESDPTGSISVSLDGMSTSNESGDDDDDDDDDDETTTGSGGDSTMNVGEPALDEATSSVQRQPSPFGSKISAESTGRETRAARRGNRTEPSIPITLKTSFRAVRGGRDKEPDGDKK